MNWDGDHMGTRPMSREEEEGPPFRQSPRTKGETAGNGILVLAVAFIAFVGGALAILSETFPYEPLRNAYRAGTALIEQREDTLDPHATDLWEQARTEARGVTVHDPARAFDGYTLYTSGDGAYARLITMDGHTAHEWRQPFSAVWTRQAAVEDPQPDRLIFMNKTRVLPNGDLLASYEAAGDTPWGYGLVKLDRDSNVIWRYLQSTHHDFDVAPDGRIFALTNAFTSEKVGKLNLLERPRLDDFLVILSEAGEELKKISLTHAMSQSPYEGYLHAAPAFSLEDPLHTNNVEYIDAAKAENLAVGEEGQILLSFRDLGVIAILDPETENVVWATRGPWFGQHDPSILSNGDILLFDNLGGFRDGNASRILEFDPRTMRVKWQYTGNAEHPFFSQIRGAAERLPNGNTLITESNGGRLFEVAPEGDIVWEYVNPVRGGEGDRYLPTVAWGQRLSPDDFHPEFRAAIDQRTETSP